MRTIERLKAEIKQLAAEELHGAVVTIDAMGCQRAAQIIDQNADYVLGLKGNQGTLHEDVALLFDERQDGFAGHAVTLHESFEKGHGRLETRLRPMILRGCRRTTNGRACAALESRRELGRGQGEVLHQLAAGRRQAERGAQPLGRREWAALGDGHGVPRRRVPHTERARAGQLRHRHMASMRRGKGKNSMRASRHIAGWDEDFLYSLLTT